MVILVHWPELQHTSHLYGHTIPLSQILLSPAFKALYHSDRNAFNDTRTNLVKALELTFWRLDEWKCTYNKFILPDVLPLLQDDVLASVCLEIIGKEGMHEFNPADLAFSARCTDSRWAEIWSTARENRCHSTPTNT
jgi:hypothetical protein